MAGRSLRGGEVKAENVSPCKIPLKRLVKKEVIKRIYRYGQRWTAHNLTLLYLKNDSPEVNYAIHVGKRYGLAVKRNKIKRVFREFLLSKKDLLIGYDLILIPKWELRGLTFSNVYNILEHVIAEADIPKRKEWS